MADLHAALKYLSPVDYSEIPTAEKELDTYLADLFSQAELIIESIPIPAPSGKEAGTSHVASNASEVTLSSARSAEPSSEYAALQKQWGKPIKVGAKENPLSMSVYKLSGKDSNGAWFARRSVHEGIGFEKFKKSLEMEFEQSMAVEGPPGAGNIRGIGSENRVEDLNVKDRGRVEILFQSAQFPGPTTPRDFVTMLITSSSALSSSGKSEGQQPRHHMMVSKPCKHPETQQRDGFVRGSYQSVEFIREVPRSSGSGDASGNPVEWIMVTRSDPGGSVPRFMVERGTPGSICSDAVKFLDWACQRSPDEGVDKQDSKSNDDKLKTDAVGGRPKTLASQKASYQSWRGSRVAGVEGDGEAEHTEAGTSIPPQYSEKEVTPVAAEQTSSNGGILGAVGASLASITPQVVLDHLPGATTTTTADERPSEKSIPTNTAPTSASAPPTTTAYHAATTSETPHPTNPTLNDAASIHTTTSFASAESFLSSSSSSSSSPTTSSLVSPTRQRSTSTTATQQPTRHEKELQRLESRHTARKARLTQSLFRLNDTYPDPSARDDPSYRKRLDKHDKALKKTDEKYQKKLRETERKIAKENKKREAKRAKREDKDEKGRLGRERDEARNELEGLRRENESLRKEVDELRIENESLKRRAENLGAMQV